MQQSKVKYINWLLTSLDCCREANLDVCDHFELFEPYEDEEEAESNEVF